MTAYQGKLLRVDLTSGKTNNEGLNPAHLRDYIGGSGLAVRLLYDELSPTAKALGAENKLVFMAGPLTGSGFPGSAVVSVSGKSPATGLLIHDHTATPWGLGLKRAGYDGIIVQGAASRPTYLVVWDGAAELKDAASLWGQDTTIASNKLKELVGHAEAMVLTIGPAGERQAFIASLVAEQGRFVGRGGLGAVMGSKNLKAIVVGGNQAISAANPTQFRVIQGRFTNAVRGNTINARLAKWGTGYFMDSQWQSGAVPVRHWQAASWNSRFIAIGGKRLSDSVRVARPSCPDCPVACTTWVQVGREPRAVEGPGPEYEALVALGSLCANPNLEAICQANLRCLNYGLDPTSAGVALAFAMEARERGLLPNGPQWGDADAMLALIDEMGQGRGLGATLSRGVRQAAQAIGQGSQEFAIHIKGLETGIFDPRAYFSLAPTYATGPNPPCEQRGAPMIFELYAVMPEAGVLYRQDRFDGGGKGLLAKVSQDFANLLSSLGVCMHPGLVLAPLHVTEVLQPLIDANYTSAQVLAVGERITNLCQIFNLRAGDTSAPELPRRWLQPLTEGGSAGHAPDLSRQLAEYRDLRGWNKEGVPTKEKLEALGLGFAVQYGS